MGDRQFAVASRGQNAPAAGGVSRHMQELLPIWTREQLDVLERLKQLYH